jgi:hypothetical protein
MQNLAWARSALIAAAGGALWMLLAAPDRLFGWDAGRFGTVLLIACAWGLLYLVSGLPGDALRRAASPAEWKAWIGTGFIAVAMAYFIAKLPVLQAAVFPHDAGADAVGRNLVMLLIAWAILSSLLASRWRGAVEEDERDRQIAVRAESWGHGALIFSVVGVSVTFGFTPADRLEWATPRLIGNLLVFALMCGWLCKYVATLAYYWIDRSGVGQ